MNYEHLSMMIRMLTLCPAHLCWLCFPGWCLWPHHSLYPEGLSRLSLDIRETSNKNHLRYQLLHRSFKTATFKLTSPFVATLWGSQDLSSPTRNWTWPQQRKHQVLTTGPPANSLTSLPFNFSIASYSVSNGSCTKILCIRNPVYFSMSGRILLKPWLPPNTNTHTVINHLPEKPF